jgi:DNA polymerase III delta subunit
MNVYLIHGPDPVQIQSERLRILDHLLPRDQRDENLTEFDPGGARPLTLNSLLPNLLSELGTVSFFPGATRVAVVNDLSDFWSSGSAEKASGTKTSAKPESGKSKKKPIEPLARLVKYLESDFESTGNALIFTVFEDPDKRRAVDKRKKIVQWIKANGNLISFDSHPMVFQLGDAILEQDLTKALGLFRQVYKKGRPDQAMGVHSAILRQVRFLLQAKVELAAERQHSPTVIAGEFLPANPKMNLARIHAFPQRKYRKAASGFSAALLTRSIQDLYEISRHIIPSGGDPYVADTGYLMEQVLIRLCSSHG